MRSPSSKCRVTMTAQTLYNKRNWVLNVFSENAICAKIRGSITCVHLKTNSVCWVAYILRNPLEYLPAFVPNGSIETVSITSLTGCRQVSIKSDKGRTMPVCAHQSFRFHRRKTFAVGGRIVMTDENPRLFASSKMIDICFIFFF